MSFYDKKRIIWENKSEISWRGSVPTTSSWNLKKKNSDLAGRLLNQARTSVLMRLKRISAAVPRRVKQTLLFHIRSFLKILHSVNCADILLPHTPIYRKKYTHHSTSPATQTDPREVFLHVCFYYLGRLSILAFSLMRLRNTETLSLHLC